MHEYVNLPASYGSSPHPRGTHHAHRGWRDIRRFIPAPAGNTAHSAAAGPLWSVHPRTRGEHSISGPQQSQFFGSSPHPRGTHKFGFCGVLGFRFIPAPAGNTQSRTSAAAVVQVHPRTRGEHGWLRKKTSYRRGSSPHPRGTPSAGLGQEACRRFIPAPAGNTQNRLLQAVSDTGSSPHPRGTLEKTDPERFEQRFIPAPAGNTSVAHGHYDWRTVHPRTRGEHTCRNQLFSKNNSDL